eukprot:6076448-Amphidinium_carterae.1
MGSRLDTCCSNALCSASAASVGNACARFKRSASTSTAAGYATVMAPTTCAVFRSLCYVWWKSFMNDLLQHGPQLWHLA